jgi:energy-coupling factor transport system permease protein
MTILALRHARRSTIVHRLHPLTKLLAVLVFWLISLGSFNPLVLLALIVLALVVQRVAEIPFRSFLLLCVALTPIFVILTLINGFMFYNGRTPIFRLGDAKFTVEGVLFGITISLKILSVVAFIPLVTFTTSMPRLMAGLAMLRLPYKLVFTFGVAMRFTPLVAHTFRDIVAAQRLRAYDLQAMGLPRRVIRGYVPIFIPLLLTLLRRSADLDVAIESRAFGAPVKRTYLDELRFGPADAAVVAVSLAALVAIALLGGSIPQLVDLRNAGG